MAEYERDVHVNSIQTLINVARNEKTPLPVLQKLAQHRMPLIWAAVASNSATPPELLQELAERAIPVEAEQERRYEAECECDKHKGKREATDNTITN